MNTKGFTLVELLGAVLILAIILMIAVPSYTKHLRTGNQKAFEIEEKSFLSTVKGAYVDCLSNHTNNDFCKNHKELGIGNLKDTIYLKELVDDSYIDRIKNPYNIEEFCDMNNSYVNVTVDESTLGKINIKKNYEVCLICGEHKSNSCIN